MNVNKIKFVVAVVVETLSHVQLFVTPWTAACQASVSFNIPRVCSNLHPLSQWGYLTISFSAAPFFFAFNTFPASGCLPKSQLFPSGGQSIGASLSASVLPKNIQYEFHLGLLLWFPWSPRDSQEPSAAQQFESIESLVRSLLYDQTLTSIHDYWKTNVLTI